MIWLVNDMEAPVSVIDSPGKSEIRSVSTSFNQTRFFLLAISLCSENIGGTTRNERTSNGINSSKSDRATIGDAYV